MISGLRRILWLGGRPARTTLVWSIRLYRATLGTVIGGSCRFFPSCSAYAEKAIAEVGATRGVCLSLWRLVRCSPLTAGGIDHPPSRHLYDVDIRMRGHQEAEAGG